MKIGSSKTVVPALLVFPETTLNVLYKFKYLGVTFTSDGRQSENEDIRSGKASALLFLIVQKRDYHERQNSCCRCFSRYLSHFLPINQNDLEFFAMTERVWSEISAKELRYQLKINGVMISTKCVTFRLENLKVLIRFFSGSKNFRFDDVGLASKFF